MRQMRSIVSTSASCSCSNRRASKPNGRLQRLTMKPGPSLARITVFPIASPVACASASARGEDSTPAITSSRRISGAGLKKCMPTTRSGWLAPFAIAVTSSEEVFVASTHSSLTISESFAYISCLSSRRSGAASITSSQSAKAAMSSTGSRRSEAAAASSSVSLPFTISLRSPSSALAMPRASASPNGSCSSVRAPERAAS